MRIQNFLSIADLPVGNAPKPIDYPHFPARWQAAVWRNRGLVPPKRLASVLRYTETQLFQAVEDMMEWSPARLAYILKEENFFWAKVGHLKLSGEAQIYAELTPEQRKATRKLKNLMEQYFPVEQQEYLDPLFAFAERYASRSPGT